MGMEISYRDKFIRISFPIANTSQTGKFL